MERWGFTYKTLHTWVKIPKDIAQLGVLIQDSISQLLDGSFFPYCAPPSKGPTELRVRKTTGHYGRGGTEHLIIASRGKIKAWSTLDIRDIPNVMFEPISPMHSRKPDVFWARANRLREALGCPPSIELFAREHREGWDSWGGELDCRND